MTVKAVKAACVKVALPEAFSLPRKFGVSSEYLGERAYRGASPNKTSVLNYLP
ncbi:hypothetical protein [Pyrobaculum aerophilum]|uniref:hypothetical protein n=1 Tax=Pyrobaculum aerophilum TaxID=13773 RepID=UPI002FD967A1